MRYLLVEDNRELAEAVVGRLALDGHAVDHAPTLADAEACLASATYDLILLDVMMATKTEGFDVARKMHESEELKDCPIILITGVRADMNLPFGFEPDEEWLPVKEVLEKPVKPDVLLKAIEEHIRKNG